MQQPTCTNLRIRSTQDAHRIFYAVQTGLLQMVTRRLDAEERLALSPGCIYVWEERGPHSEITGLGIERFTEGRRWTPSRVRDEFLFYYERYSSPSSNRRWEPTPRPHDWDQLVKQTYSVWVDTEKGRRKWHLTAYFTDRTVNDLRTVDDIPRVRDLASPPGLYQSTRVAKSRNRSEEQPNLSNTGSAKVQQSSVSRTYAPFSHYNHYPSHSTSAPSSESVTMYDPYRHSAANQHPPQPSADTFTTPSQQNVLLPAQGTSLALPCSSPTYGNSAQPTCVAVSSPGPALSSSMLPNPVPSSSVWTGLRASASPHTSQVVPLGMSSPSGHSEPRSLPPVSTVYDVSCQLAPIDDASRSVSSRGSISAYTYDAPCAPRDSSYELASHDGSDSEGRRDSLGPERVLALAPIHALERRHPYRRDPLDDKTLRLLPR
ncbi:hypothetical protein D9615_004733 [Tricholomella constricta]|uniref:cAMP-independent regulatory protein pac2 n=1 Tax=Tricholomella constricta TaxID=117010 RepID=A0A8H5M4G1_9AGAR|nr:hypothetical protein D9615_004733 [Tricholomella constricta]